ncbi:MAG: CPBP family intramembrane metalloprotease [Methanophagales archaeon]|nr:CPBP family intramembrane metalloprotease [Methanophagales archaeon]
MSISVFIKRHPVLTYFALTFTISWGGILIVVSPGGIPGTTDQIEMLFPIALMTLLVGPSVAGILSTGLVHGRTGFRELLSRLFKWRVGARWYAVALLITPLLVTVTLFVLSQFSPVFLPDIFTTKDKASLLLTGIMVGLMGGFLEELGWTGFAVPGMRLRYGVLTTGLIVGFLWGAWHFLVTFWASGDSSGALSLPLFLPPLVFYVAVLPVFRVLMVWVYNHTDSLLIAMLMHASLTGSTLFVLKPQATNVALMIYYLVLAAVLWIFVAVVAVAKGGKLSRHPIGLNDEVK